VGTTSGNRDCRLQTGQKASQFVNEKYAKQFDVCLFTEADEASIPLESMGSTLGERTRRGERSESRAGHDIDRDRDRDREGTRRGEGMALEFFSAKNSLSSLVDNCRWMSVNELDEGRRAMNIANQQRYVCTEYYGRDVYLELLPRTN
jgi:hypothetical protein